MLAFLCLTSFPNKQTEATGAEGGQVSVPGKITFELEEKKNVDSKKIEKTSFKNLERVLPKTGEKRSDSNTLVGIFFLLLVGIFFKKKVGAKE